ncbi:MAG: SMP-30/gluconolactonase/LRE family protein, partial [Actinomycetota bacterium]|nr:SMP-30/gluconolactonase/LRE family protein [Actinomycetota bacterium]MEC9449674.1 SMP-30/gluconolactonase/LRE family protein [Actinomycetota bacterium]
MAQLELVLDDLDFGEGPRWHDGRLWYSDFYQHRVYAVSPDGERETVLDLGDEQPSGLGWMPDGSLLVVAMVARQVLRVVDGEVNIHADLSEVAT